MAAPPLRDRHELALRAAALAYPETHEGFPWDRHRAVKVRRKVFLITTRDAEGLSVSVKLPWSAEGALQFPFCEPTGYGLGRAGWVTASFAPGKKPPLEVLRSWIDESYRAVAPKRVVAALGAAAPAGRQRASRRAPAARLSGRRGRRRTSSAGR
jgi:predicted DNA-binding protein (MmcQ/YjbR family)